MFWDPENPSAAMEQIKRLDTDETAFEAMLATPYLLQPAEETVQMHFSYLSESPSGLRYRVRERLERCRLNNRGLLTRLKDSVMGLG